MQYGLAQDVAEPLRGAVIAEIDADPAVHAWEVGVAAEDGVITLSGTVGSLAVKISAENAAKRVAGVRSVANDLRVRAMNERTDTDIAREAAHRLRNNVAIPVTVQAVVSDGYVTLDGLVTWTHQRAAAETAVKYLRGVKGVTNVIKVLEVL
jgi:Predicted periplasmic or secreted lipoprotein